jgi:hypothetical protein
VVDRRRLLTPALAAALLILVAFLTSSGDLSSPPTQVPTSWVDAALILAGGGAAAALVLTRRGGGGGLSFALFAAVGALTALSIAWSVAPDQSWEESGRTAAYVAVFGVGLVAARFSRADSRAALLAVTLAATALCVWALAVKALDLNLYGQPDYGPVLAPFGYWNATGLAGAMALPGLIWMASRADQNRLVCGLATAGVAIAASVVALTYSRSAVAAAVLATILPLFLIRARRRAAVMLALGLTGAVPICVLALTNHRISSDIQGSIYGGVKHIDRGSAELLLGLVTIAVAVILTALGAALSGYANRTPQPARRVTWFDRGLLGLVAAVPLVIVIFLVTNSRGPFGEISHLWKELTSVNGPSVSGGVSRLGSIASSRAAYWRQALSVGEHNLLGGTGAGSFFPAHLRYSTATLLPRGQDIKHAHSYVLDTFASLGLVGLVLNLGLFLAWCRDATRAVRGTRRFIVPTGAAFEPGLHSVRDGERDARLALIGTVIAFGVSSALDWTWYFPGVTVPALVAAGWIAGVAGRSPRVTAVAATGAPSEPATAPSEVAGPGRPATAPPRRPTLGPGTIIGLTALAAVTLVVAWESLAPMRSTQSIAASQAALIAQQGGTAESDAQAAISEDPLSALAREELATVYGALNKPARERAELVKATQIQPDNPQPFAALGGYLLCSADDDHAALAPLERATMLDITDTDKQIELLTVAMANAHPSQMLCGEIA